MTMKPWMLQTGLALFIAGLTVGTTARINHNLTEVRDLAFTILQRQRACLP